MLRKFAIAISVLLAAPTQSQPTAVQPTKYDDMFGAWSPDGRRIAFMSDRSGDPEIYVADSDGSNLKRLTAIPGRDAHPSWSPDGKTILFQSPREGGDVRLFEMNADGSGVRRLTGNSGFCGVPTLSPNGQTIAYQCSDGPEKFGTAEAPWRIFLLDRGVLKPRVVTYGPGNDQVPNWSPDGSKLLFFSDRGGTNQVYELDFASGAVRQLTKGPESHLVASYSPDSRQIVLSRGELGGKTEIFILADGASRAVTETPVFGGATFSPDGTRLLMQRETDNGVRLFVLPQDGSAEPEAIEFR